MAPLRRWLMAGWLKESEPITDFEIFCYWEEFNPRSNDEIALRNRELAIAWKAVCLADIERMGAA